jgi:hypothetical protein
LRVALIQTIEKHTKQDLCIYQDASTMKKIASILCLLIGCTFLSAQVNSHELCVDFAVGSTKIDASYRNNGEQQAQMLQFLQTLHQDSTVRIQNITFKGITSPDGTCVLNKKLAQARLLSIEQWLRSQIDMHDSLLVYEEETVTWDEFTTVVENSNIAQKDSIVAILNQPSNLPDSVCSGKMDHRVRQLKRMDNGAVWKQLNQEFFDGMRRACVVVTTNQHLSQNFKPIIPLVKPQIDRLVVDTVLPPRVERDTLVTDTVPAWTRQLTVKTNALFWAIGMANAAVDIDLAEHWSLSIPVFYSAWDYFVNDIKFRAVGLQPEVRYWIKDTNKDGWFVGAHFGMAYWNVAVNGAYRYQDRNREEPALGGGLGFGYRLPISKNGKWKVEFALGVGVYHAPYDKFVNVPNGPLVESSNYVYWGIDQAAVSFSYTFDLKKKGGKQ